MSQYPTDKFLAERSQRFYLAGRLDPTLFSINAPKGAMYLRVGAGGGAIYSKLDDGNTTNWVLNGTGAGGANVFLSNLSAPTSINQSLLPQWTNAISLGDDTKHWLELYTSNIIKTGGNLNIQTQVSGNIVLNSFGYTSNSNKQIKDVANPTANQDAATKSYVDGLVSGAGLIKIVANGPQLDAAFVALRAAGGGIVILTGPDFDYAPAANRDITNITIMGSTTGIAMTKIRFTNANYLYGSLYRLSTMGIDPFGANAPFRVVGNAAFLELDRIQMRGPPSENILDLSGAASTYIWARQVISCPINNTANLTQAFLIESGMTFRNGGTIYLDSGSSAAGAPASIVYTDSAGKVLNDSTVVGLTVKDALNTLAASSSGANVNLSNLASPTSINQNLIPQAGKTLGSSTALWGAFLNQAQIYDSAEFRKPGGNKFLGISYTAITPSSVTPKGSIFTQYITGDINFDLGLFTASTDQINTGNIYLETGNANAINLNSGDINIKTGSITGGLGLKGVINLDGRYVNVNSTYISNVLDPVLAQDAATKNYVDNSFSSAMNPYFGGYVDDNDTLKANIAAQKAAPATVIENTGVTANLQALINAASSGDVIEIQHNGPYGFITIPGSVPMTIRAGSGFQPVFTAQNTVRLLNNVNNVYLIGLKFLNCTTSAQNEKGSAICFNTNMYKADGFTVSDCEFEKCTGSAVLLAYHMTIGGDNYADPYLPSELSSNISFVDCNFLRAGTDIIEGACLHIRGVDGCIIRRCHSDTGDGTDAWAGEGRVRSFMLHYAINSVIEDCTAKKLLTGAQENFKFDQLSAGLSTFKNEVTVRRCYAEGGFEGFDNDDQGNIGFNQCVSWNTTRGFVHGKSTSEGSILSCFAINCNYGVYIPAAVPTATLDIRFNTVFRSSIKDYELLNGYILDTTNLQGSRPSLLKKMIDEPSSGGTSKKETLTYVSGVYTYNLANLVKPDSVTINVASGLVATEGVGLDYTLATVGPITQITLLPNFYNNLINGDNLFVKYNY